MSQHLHPAFVEGCYRCDLSRDEVTLENPTCYTCDTGNHDECDNMGIASDGGLTSCFCHCWDDDDEAPA